MFAFPTNFIEIFNTVGNLKNSKDVRVNGVSAEALKTLLLLNNFILVQFLNLSFSRGWFLKCLKDTKVNPLHKSGDILTIRNYWSTSLSPAIRKLLEKIMYK